MKDFHSKSFVLLHTEPSPHLIDMKNYRDGEYFYNNTCWKCPAEDDAPEQFLAE